MSRTNQTPNSLIINEKILDEKTEKDLKARRLFVFNGLFKIINFFYFFC